ncbi:MAG: hypothetical protein ACXQTU_04885, partial [Candidatus Nezhaarchaeales archaeon]
MIHVITLKLTASQDVTAQQQSFTGYLIRGLFYTLLDMANKKLAMDLHQRKGLPAPFAVKPPHVIRNKIHVYVWGIPEETQFNVSLSVLEDKLAQDLCQSLLSCSGIVRLGKGFATVNEVQLNKITVDALLSET